MYEVIERLRVFISGGCKNGKSYHAQRLAKAQRMGLLYYVATMKAVDAEDVARIARHRKERDGWNFNTIEQPVNIEKILTKCDCGGSFLLDSLTALLANEMFLANGAVNMKASGKITDGLTQVISEIKNIVIVSDYIYGDAVTYTPLTEAYRKSLAHIDCAVAQMCDVVLEISYSSVTAHKGGAVYETIY